jgi:tungstate transport system ATP-binding protein
MTSALRLAGVRVRYGTLDVLEVAALDVRRGEVLAIVGPNGSGKSTLLRVLGLLETPAAGQVWVQDRPVTVATALAERRRMASVFQQPSLTRGSVADNVALGLRFRGVARSEAAARVDRWLARLGIATLRDRPARGLSGGEAQRVALARALVLEPDVLLLDEPFAALDAPARAALIPDLATILRADAVTTVLVTHDRAEAQALADRVAVLLDGRIRQLDDTARVFWAPASEEVARFVGVETIVEGDVVGVGDGVATVAVGPRRLEVAAAAAPGERVRVAVRPEDVTVLGSADAGGVSSARNRLPGVVRGVSPSTPYVRVVIDCGFPLVAAVTSRSVSDLGLAPGVPVTAVFKASSAHLIRYAGPAAGFLDTPRGAGL